MNNEKIARRYAQAFFHTSQQKNILDSVEKDFVFISSACEKIKELKSFIIYNDISSATKETALKKIFEQNIEPFTFSSLHLLLSKHREYLLELIIREFTLLYHQQKNLLELHIYSTVTLDEYTKKQIIDKFQKETQKKIVPLFHLNPDLIAGIKITYNNFQIDGSVQGGLHRLREKLTHDMIKQ